VSTPRPNILFLLSDQHSPRFAGFAGSHAIATPALDRLAAEGLVFDQAYCQNPVCAASRASLMTGTYSRDHGVYDNRHIFDDRLPTFPATLAASGYRTCVIGKTHFNGDQYHGYQERPYGDLLGQAHQPDPCRLPGRGESGLGGVVGAAGPSGIPLPQTQTEICVAEAAKWLQTHAHHSAADVAPFCLSVHFDKPHFPLCPPAAYFERHAGKVRLPDVPTYLPEHEVPFVRAAMRNNGEPDPRRLQRAAHERALAAYFGCIEWIDNAIGRVLATLEHLGLADNTLVIYSSDHGEMAGERGTWQKTVFFEASARVPMAMRWPQGITPGRRTDALVGLIDLYPTFCDLAGVPIPESCRGRSMRPLFAGERFDRNEIYSESVVLGEPEHAGCMLRTGNWKYCRYLDGAEELYALDVDRDEIVNLAAEDAFADLRAAFRQRVDAFWEPECQRTRYDTHPRATEHKHTYPFSNQFVLGDCTIIDARP
jgi:choline-sulfatase